MQTEKPCATQSLHRPPADPHARVSLPVRQTPFASQHPVGQLEALHAPGVGVPPSSVSGSRLERPQAKNTSTARTTKKDVKTREAREVDADEEEEEEKRMARTYRDRSVAEREPSR